MEVEASVVTAKSNRQVKRGLLDREDRVMMDPGEHRSASQHIGPRVGVTPRYIDTFLLLPAMLPFDSDTVRGILRLDTKGTGHEPGPHVFQPDQTDTGYRVTICENRPKGFWQDFTHDIRINAVVGENPPIDDAVDDGDAHSLFYSFPGVETYPAVRMPLRDAAVISSNSRSVEYHVVSTRMRSLRMPSVR